MTQRPPELDMTIEGGFRTPQKPPIMTRVLIWAVIVAVIAGSLALAAFALWVALIILPVALGAAVLAWLVWRFQVWRARGSIGRGRDVFRP
jgi:hypothetical protein